LTTSAEALSASSASIILVLFFILSPFWFLFSVVRIRFHGATLREATLRECEGEKFIKMFARWIKSLISGSQKT
jgi:hypothetical protein